METILDSEQSESKTLEYSGFWIRFAAAIIDSIILWIVMGIISMVFFGGGFISSAPLFSSEFYAELIASTAIGWLYSAVMESSAGQATLGKAIIGIKVTDLNGERISFARATGRHFAKYISTIILLIGYIMVAFTEKKQGLHDMMAGTFVVRK